jgi:hypothetical protein
MLPAKLAGTRRAAGGGGGMPGMPGVAPPDYLPIGFSLGFDSDVRDSVMLPAAEADGSQDSD